MGAPDILMELARPWAALYADSLPVSTGVLFVHFGALVLAGGSAVAADRETLLTGPDDADGRIRVLEGIHRAHRWVLIGLGAAVVSGLLLVASDLETYLGSTAYWIKMTLFVLLLANGARLRHLERRAVRTDPVAWRALRRMAGVSLVLWAAIVFVSILVVTTA